MLSFFLRRTPFQTARWRLIPYGLRKCREACKSSEIRCIRTRHGFRINVDISDWLGSHVYVTGEYESTSSSLIKSRLRRGGVFVDVGANIGYFSLLAATQVGPTGCIYAFEPVPRTRAKLLENVQLNNFTQCQVFDVAATNENGHCDIHVGPTSHSGVSSLRQIDDASESVRVPTARLDTLIDIDRKVDLVKIDIEGAECHALEGMVEILGRWRPDLVLEITSAFLEGLGKKVSDIDALLKQFNYKSCVISHKGLRRVPALADAGLPQFNAFCTASDVAPVG
jgi:FkbM family methyltransferase